MDNDPELSLDSLNQQLDEWLPFSSQEEDDDESLSFETLPISTGIKFVLVSLLLAVFWILLTSIFMGRKFYRLFFSFLLHNPSGAIKLVLGVALSPKSPEFCLVHRFSTGRLKSLPTSTLKLFVVAFDKHVQYLLKTKRDKMEAGLVQIRALHLEQEFGSKLNVKIYTEFELLQKLKEVFQLAQKVQATDTRIMSSISKLSSSFYDSDDQSQIESRPSFHLSKCNSTMLKDSATDGKPPKCKRIRTK